MTSISIFLIPFYYTFATRIREKKERIAWVTTYLIPVSAFTLLSAGGLDLNTLAATLIGMTSLYNFYELGYIENDTETTKHEKNPTKRLKQTHVTAYEENKKLIIFFRLALGVSLLLLTFFTNKTLGIAAAISSTSIITLYFVYNRIRNKSNIVLFCLLRYLRYFGLVIPSTATEFLILNIAYPICASIEFSAKDRFNIRYLSVITKNQDFFRAIYHIATLTLLLLINNYHRIDFNILAFAAYFSLYRLAALIFARRYYR